MYDGLPITYYIKFALSTASLLPLVCMVDCHLYFYIEFVFTTASLLPLVCIVGWHQYSI